LPSAAILGQRTHGTRDRCPTRYGRDADGRPVKNLFTVSAMTRLLTIVPYRMTLAVAIGVDLVIGMALALMLNSGDAADPSLMVGLSVGIPAAVLLLVLPLVTVIVRPWRYVHDIDAMRAGGALVHWRYDEPAWQTANRVEGERTRRTAFTASLFALGLGVVLLLIGLAVGGENGSTFVFVGGLTGGLALTGAAAFGATSPAVMARRRKQGEIYISSLGIYRSPGGYTPMRGFGYWLENVALLGEQTPYVSFEVTVQGRYGSTSTQSLADVVVPPGREAEANDLVNRLRAEALGRAQA
jgi:hypothetical protein